MRRVLIWLGTGILIGLLLAIFSTALPESDVAALLIVLLALWSAVTVVLVFWWFWRRLTYRIGVRLFISYLLIAGSTFLVCILFGGFVLYMIMGQYTSVRFGNELQRVLAGAQADCRQVLDSYRRYGWEAAQERFNELQERPDPAVPRVMWRGRFDGRELNLGGAGELPRLNWIEGDIVTAARRGAAAFALAAAAEGGDMVAAVLPLDAETARVLTAAHWYDVYFAPLDEDVPESDGDRRVMVSTGQDRSVSFSFNEDATPLDDVWKQWPEAERGILWKPFVVWFRLAEEVRDLGTGELLEDPKLVSLLRTSPAMVWQDFVLSRFELGSHLRAGLLGLGTFFLIVYGIALLVAATMIYSITRSTARLTRGAREVGLGRLDYRIPVKRRDQLGDLAMSFNHMTQSVQDMVADVAEKERLTKELELAREIQESLLPDRHLRHGSLSVHAAFRPATEVGGDYFDLFPIESDRLVVVVGDVAGHGLHTGLLMASLKSSVAALVHEGYSGGELVAKVNDLLRAQSSGPTMATLGIVEIDVGRDRLRLTNAGHPPAFLISDGRVVELLAGSVPLGSPLCRPLELPPSPFTAGSRLLLYSDGLVEATDADGEPFGYERLERLLAERTGLAGAELVVALLALVDDYVGDRPLADDLMIVVVERGTAAAAEDQPLDGSLRS